MDNLPRLSFYLSSTLIVSGVFTLLTNDLLPKIAVQNWISYLLIIGLGLVYINITFVISRRFMRRLDNSSTLPFIFSIFVALAPIVWSFIVNVGLFGNIKFIYLATIIISCFLGGYLGQKAGIKAQSDYKKQLYEYLRKSGQLPEDLKRPHDNLNKN